MNIHFVQPCGFCHGVKKVLEKTQAIIDDYPSANIYLIGNVVHNELVCQKLLRNHNVHILDNKEHDRLSLLKSIATDNNVIIFSAHGTDPKAITYAETKGWKIFDLTCPYVLNILSKITYAINHGFHVAYYGDKNHPEAIAAKATGGNNLTVYKTKEDLKKVLDMPKVQVLCQSTMNRVDFNKTREWFTEPAIIKFSETLCQSSKQRQSSIEEMKPYDIVFVLSDKNSHNGNELYQMIKAKQNNVVFVDPQTYKLDKKVIANKKDCAIASSSSVSQEQIDKFVNQIKELV